MSRQPCSLLYNLQASDALLYSNLISEDLMPIVSLENVSKSYGQGRSTHHALSEINLSVEKGVIQGIIGFSGAGKSTLLRCISRLERPDSGRVVIEGSDLAHLSGHELRIARRKIGVVFQQFHLLRSRTVAANIALPLEIDGQEQVLVDARVKELLQWFGLEDKAAAYPSQLSGGQRQRVALARALAARPAVLLSDEPTSALDTETTASVLELLRKVRDELNVTVLLITHELDAVRSICDRVAVLDRGQIVEEGPVEEVLLQPKSEASRRLLGDTMQIGRVAEYLGGKSDHAHSVFLELQLLGASATEPLLSDLARVLDVKITILRAEIGKLNRSAYGFLLVEVTGERGVQEQAKRMLIERGAVVTVIDPWSVAVQGRGL
ncbi:MAG: Methionine import ATP-binding protein MetN [Acidobacteriaceae bacterium]|nr:Methionine import ATP-binding protein MetN [Acidobacteriaceae bacterium]